MSNLINTDEGLINKILENHDYCPCLLLGKYVNVFKKIYTGRIFIVSNLDSVRDIVERFSGLDGLEGKVFVIDGIGYLSTVGQNSLLKFIEESKFPIILLSYHDKVSPIIKSRIKFIFKKSITEIKTLKFMSIRDALRIVEEKKKDDKDYNDLDEISFYANNCPAGFVWKYTIPNYDYSSKRMLRMACRV